ncbi:MAG: hypothetical protein BWX55_01248 [Deltaproteobacteria bacterium ADurb.Bin022]|nr:MAG: hypothetical protein BWX55_01248 [Deltaproteobacteria bacterium ADurb.Bin022]
MRTDESGRVEMSGLGEINLIGVKQFRFLRLTDQFLPIVGMRDINQFLSTLAHRLAHQIRHTVFRRHQVHRLTVGKLERQIIDGQNDIWQTFPVAAGQSENGTAVFGKRRSDKKFLDISRTGGDIPLAGMQRDIACQVNFSGRQNGYGFVIRADYFRIGNHILRLKFNQRIAVQPAHQFFTAQQIGRGTLAAEHAFVAIGHGAALNKVHQRIRKKRRMDAEIFFRCELNRQGFVKRANPE